MADKPKDGGPAFPLVYEEERHVAYSGMTLRDYFAGQALGSTASFYADNEEGGRHRDAMARQCYRIADAMIAAREAAHG